MASNKISGHIEVQYPSRFVKAADLKGRDVTVVLVGGEWENLVMIGGKKNRKITFGLATTGGKTLDKFLAAGVTVLRQIGAAVGETEVSKFAGKTVTLYPSRCRGSEGGEVDCVRVRVRTDATASGPTAEMMALVEASDKETSR